MLKINFLILDVPCNQFGHQAPGSDEEIHEFCTLKFGADFPQLKKSNVNGANELPLYTWLKEQKGVSGSYDAKLAAVMEKLYNEANPEPRKKDDIQWNFTKFLIDRNGNVIARFEPTTDMKEVEKQVDINDIGKRLLLDINTTSPLIKRMEKLGLVARHDSETDKRQQIVYLTEKGKAMRKDAAKIPACMIEKFGECGINIDHLTAMIPALDEMIGKMGAK